jgi:hypothetical protein
MVFVPIREQQLAKQKVCKEHNWINPFPYPYTDEVCSYCSLEREVTFE